MDTKSTPKSAWAVKEAEFLGHWITPNGIKPLQKKIQRMLAIDKQKTLKQLRRFMHGQVSIRNVSNKSKQ